MGYELKVGTFDMGSERDKAKKLPEEAAEAYGAWEEWDDDPYPPDGRSLQFDILGAYDHVLYECCDTIQAACNLMDSMEATQEDVDAAMEAVHRHNHERGRC